MFPTRKGNVNNDANGRYRERNDGYRRHKQRNKNSSAFRSITQTLGAAPDPIGVTQIYNMLLRMSVKSLESLVPFLC